MGENIQMMKEQIEKLLLEIEGLKVKKVQEIEDIRVRLLGK